MDRISGLSDELLVKILSFVPTKEVVSTSILSKRWEFLWTWVPKLEFWSRHRADHPVVLMPSRLYTCKALVTLTLNGWSILVDVPRTVCLPSLKKLELDCVTYLNDDSLRLLLSYCPVLEDLFIERHGYEDNLKTIVVIVPTLLRLTLPLGGRYPCDGYIIVTPSLKCFQVPYWYNERFSYLTAHMPKLEEADLSVEDEVEWLFESITSIKYLSLSVRFTIDEESMYHDGIVFNQLEHLNLHILHDDWSNFLVRLLEDSPKLRVLKLSVDNSFASFNEEFELVSWTNDDESSFPKCLLDSLEIFEFDGYMGRPEERDFVSYILKHASHLKSSSISKMIKEMS